MTKSFSSPLMMLYINRFISLVGEYGYLVALSLIVAKDSPTALMFLWIIKSLGPSLLLPVAGTIIDKNNKKTIMVTADLIRGVMILLIPLFLHSWFLYVLILLISALRPLFTGSMHPIITTLTTEDNRHRVNSIISGISSSSYCIGPMVGGLLLAINPIMPFIIQGGAFIVSSLLLIIVRYPIIGNSNSNNQKNSLNKKIKNLLDDLKFSFSYISRSKIILLLFLSNTIYLCGGVALDAYEVLYLTEVLSMSESSYSFALSYLGLVFIFAGFLNATISKKVDTNLLFFVGIGTASLSNIILTLAPKIYIIYISFTMLAIGLTTFSTAFYTLNQSAIPIQVQGRVMSIQTIVPDIITTIIVLLAGGFLNIFPIRPVVFSLALVSAIGFIFSVPLISTKMKVSLDKETNQKIKTN
ncbi:MFS transporter [Bacillus gobiensis]|uniref:MFS transporter n=1 Tax=Bacillus gobiensis TaxID=1441095 RepID=UPI003D1C70D6